MSSLPSGSAYLTYAGGLYIYYLTTETGGVYDTQIYSSDGTPDGAELLFDIANGHAVGVITFDATPALFYVELGSGTGDLAVFGTDGTPAGTQELFTFDGAPTATVVTLNAVAQINGRELFVTQVDNDYTVYGTDGTTAGTQELFTFDANSATAAVVTLNAVAQINGNEIFFAEVNNAYTVYGSDGTTAGTHILLQGMTGTPAVLSTYTSPAFLTVTSASGQSLYATDGTAAGTHFVTSAPSSDTFAINASVSKIDVSVIASGVVVQRLWINEATGTVATAGDEYVWVGPVSGNWNNASNWEDTTLGTDPASVAPGSNDSVTFNSPTNLSQVISGTGNAAYLTFNGDNVVTGALTAGTLAVDGGYEGSLELNPGASLSATMATLNTSIIVDDASFTVSGTLTGGYDSYENSLSANDGGHIQIAALAGSGASLGVDATSSIEIGTAGGAAAGAITVDAGSTLALYSATGNVIDNGTITVESTNASLLGIDDDYGETYSLSGSGTVVLENGAGADTAYGVVSAGSLTFQLDKNATLTLGTVGAGNAINLSGPDDVLAVDAQDTYVPATNSDVISIDMEAAISGFNATDAITIDTTVTSAVYTAGATPGTGTLALNDGNVLVGTLDLIGNYSGDTFLAVPIQVGYETQVSLFQGSVAVQNGTITVGGVSGEIGSLDQLIADPNLVPNGVIATLIVDGPGAISLAGHATIDNLDIAPGGDFILNGGVVTTDPVTIDASGNISGYGTVTGAVTDNGSITANGGTLELTGAVTGTGTLFIDTQSTLKLDSSATSGLTIDFQPGGAGETLELGTPLTMSAVISNFTTADAITFAGSYATVTRDFSGDIMTVKGNGAIIAELTFAPGYSDANTSVGDVNGVVTIETNVLCFAAGTRIATVNGEVPVEQLCRGDLIVTLEGGPASPVKWIGRRRLNVAAHPHPAMVQPIRFHRGAFSDSVPHRDLLVSPDHAIGVDGVLIPARMLVNGMTIRRETQCRSVTYYHVELETHDVLLAEGLPAESYLDTGNRATFENHDGAIAMRPDFADVDAARRRMLGCCRPFAIDEDRVRPAWEHLAERAYRLGHSRQSGGGPVTADPDLTLAMNGRSIRPISVDGDRYVFIVPASGGTPRLVSRGVVPADNRPWIDDRRRLGVKIRQMVVDTGQDRRTIPVDHPTLGDGWWAVERQDGSFGRWTNSDAVLGYLAGRAVLTVELAACAPSYPTSAIA